MSHCGRARQLSCILVVVLAGSSSSTILLAEHVVLRDSIHLRSGTQREWSDFPAQAQAQNIDLRFACQANEDEWTLELVQDDVKQNWQVSLNDAALGLLHADENRMKVYYIIPPRTLTTGDNRLRVSCGAGEAKENPSDDIRVGPVIVHRRSRADVLSEGQLRIHVRDAATNQQLPARLTIVGPELTLQETSAVSDDHLAVRPGVIYTSNGQAELGVPPGDYLIYAGRGFEYSLAHQSVYVDAASSIDVDLKIIREVATDGMVACDTHIHTFTHSGHGDATIQERMISLAGEGIELPIATDHNVHVDYESVAQRMHVRDYFTPVVGNEVTTSVGHFNIFPVLPAARTPDHRLTDWRQILAQIYATPDVRVAVLNHARDLHGGTRPFGPRLHLALVGENVEGWPFRFNAMEVINSSATQTNVLQLFEDWMALLNRGYRLTPVGSSDSHDVGRHFVGQGRTYIRCDDRDVSRIDVREAVDNFCHGQVTVSYGLLVEASIEGKFGPGELAKLSNDNVTVNVRVLAPHWIAADSVELYANGSRVRYEAISARDPRPPGVTWDGQWQIDAPRHDVCLVAMATGPGIREPYWRTAKPYQPLSSEWETRVFGCTGPLWLDADGDGRWTAASDYAAALLQESGGDQTRVIELVSGYDRAVALQVAHRLHEQTADVFSPRVRDALERAAPFVQQAFRDYADAWRATERARAEQP
jgi:hypothetical protein